MSTVERLDEAVRLTKLSAYGVRFPDLIVRYGEVVVLSGPNGSGKSTVSRVVVGDLAAEGTARVLGADPFTADLKGRIGFLVKDLETMGSLTSRDILDICAAVRDCGTAYAHELAARLGLDLDRPMARLSRGQLRRLGIVQALMHEPELIVLDDPMTELDDEARQVLPTLLREAAGRGAAVLVTVQTESDAGTFADRIVPLQRDEEHSQAPEPVLVTARVARTSAAWNTERPAVIEPPRPHSRPVVRGHDSARSMRTGADHGPPPRAAAAGPRLVVRAAGDGCRQVRRAAAERAGRRVLVAGAAQPRAG